MADFGNIQRQNPPLRFKGSVADLFYLTASHGESEHYRVYCYFGSMPMRNFELFDTKASNASIGYSEKAQEYIYVTQGVLFAQDRNRNTLHTRDALVFDSSIGHTYVNEMDEMLTFMVINYIS